VSKRNNTFTKGKRCKFLWKHSRTIKRTICTCTLIQMFCEVTAVFLPTPTHQNQKILFLWEHLSWLPSCYNNEAFIYQGKAKIRQLQGMKYLTPQKWFRRKARFLSRILNTLERKFVVQLSVAGNTENIDKKTIQLMIP
jgi:2-polyprenyl-3-methyl-5-hydroxy-6-metoxy-1,4-benzoquinol methylase